MKPIALALFLIAGTSSAAAPPSRPVKGPMLLCFKYSTFQLAEHERVTDFSASPESMSLTIEGPTGKYQVGESEIWAEPKHRGRLISQRDDTAVYQPDDNRRYAIYGPTKYSPDRRRLVIWLSGEALRGNGDDKTLYERFNVRDPKGASCGHGFTYSWGFLGGG